MNIKYEGIYKKLSAMLLLLSVPFVSFAADVSFGNAFQFGALLRVPVHVVNDSVNPIVGIQFQVTYESARIDPASTILYSTMTVLHILR